MTAFEFSFSNSRLSPSRPRRRPKWKGPLRNRLLSFIPEGGARGWHRLLAAGRCYAVDEMRVIAKAFLCSVVAAAPLAATEAVQLPPPDTTGGRPLMQALKTRRSTRDFSSKPLPEQVLSNLLWAAFGINRPDAGMRTAPSAWNQQEIDIYVFTTDGVYLYLPTRHALHPVLEGDHRAATGTAAYSAQAPVSLVYVADHGRTPRTPVWEKEKFAYAHAGFIGQNVYLYCASEGLGTVIHASTDAPPLARLLGLRRDQQIILAQAVGYPAR